MKLLPTLQPLSVTNMSPAGLPTFPSKVTNISPLVLPTYPQLGINQKMPSTVLPLPLNNILPACLCPNNNITNSATLFSQPLPTIFYCARNKATHGHQTLALGDKLPYLSEHVLAVALIAGMTVTLAEATGREDERRLLSAKCHEDF
ncbi:hypothetical protein Hamer_G020151 [Homarus americanus]|uniref:Uncharacterized protein n=1 Tax=Homarus americanus TaxID=6706 RepID=A0A8J5N506_HOMAM|nr:hypothetical protein Hamer_G020151 [Homarus americanus]